MANRVWYSAATSARTTSSSSSETSYVEITFTPDANANYAVFFSAVLDQEGTGAPVTEVQAGGTTLAMRRLLYQTGERALSLRPWWGVTAYTAPASPSSTVIRLVFSTGSAGQVVGIQDGVLVIVKLTANDRFATSASSTTTTSASYVSALSLTLPAGSADYLIVGSCGAGQSAGSAPGGNFRLRAGTTDIAAYVPIRQASNVSANNRAPFAGARKYSASGGETVTIDHYADSGDTSQFGTGAIVALRVSDLPGLSHDELATEGTTSSTSFSEHNSLAFTASAVPYLFIECASSRPTSSSGSNFAGLSRTVVGGTARSPDGTIGVNSGASYAGDVLAGRLWQATPSAGSLTIATQIAVGNVAVTMKLKTHGLYAIQLEDAPEYYSGPGSLTVTASLSVVGRKLGVGAGSASVPSTMTPAGRKTGRGAGSAAGSAAPTAAARKIGRGGSDLTAIVALAPSGRRIGRGSGSLSVAPDLAHAAWRTARGAGEVAVAATLSRAGAKRARGGGDVVLAASLSRVGVKVGRGTDALVAVPVLVAQGNRQGARGGPGVLALTPVLAASGRKMAGGVGSLVAVPIASSASRKLAAGTGSALLDAVLARAGGKRGLGGGILVEVFEADSAGRKAGRGVAGLLVPHDLGGGGRRIARGPALLVLSPSLDSVVRKRAAGGGAVVAPAGFAAIARTIRRGVSALSIPPGFAYASRRFGGIDTTVARRLAGLIPGDFRMNGLLEDRRLVAKYHGAHRSLKAVV